MKKMDDLISRQAVNNAIHEEWDGCLSLYDGDTIVNDTLMAIDRLPSVQHWIPCSERLPEKNGRYIVTRGLNACGSLWNRIYIANYSDLMGIKSIKIWWQGNVGKSDFERLDDVLAWRPLPEPYKAKERE